MMTAYDDGMRTIVDIPEDQLAALADYCEEIGISRAEAVRRALAVFLRGRAGASREEAFGLWKDRDEDGLAYEDRLRSEW